MILNKVIGKIADYTCGTTHEDYYQLLKECINWHTRICIWCGKKVNNHKSVHHISRIPPIKVLMHEKCHDELEAQIRQGKCQHLKPNFTRCEVKMIADYHKLKRDSTLGYITYFMKIQDGRKTFSVYEYKPKEKKKNNHIIKWVRI